MEMKDSLMDAIQLFVVIVVGSVAVSIPRVLWSLPDWIEAKVKCLEAETEYFKSITNSNEEEG